MKFIQLVTLATGALAAKPAYLEPTLVKRQSISQVESDVNAISAAAVALDNGVKSFSGPGDVDALTSASDAVVSAINKAQSDSSGFPDDSLTVNDAVGLLTPIGNLAAVVNTTVDDLIAKKPTFASYNLCGQVLTQVQAQQSAATSFSTTLIDKLVAVAKPVGENQAAPINAALARAASAFQSCPAGSTSSSTTSSTGKATSVPPSYTTSTAVPPPYYSTSTPAPPPYYSTSTPVPPPYYSTSTPVPPPYYSTSTVVPPPYYPTTTSTTCYSNTSAPVVPPPYTSTPPSYNTTTTPGSVPPPPYTTTGTPGTTTPGSVPGTTPGTVPGTTPGTPITPTTSPTSSPTLVPGSGASPRQAVGLGSLAVAVVAAVAAL